MILRVCLFLFIFILAASYGLAQTWHPKALDLGESLFTPINNKDDNDNDYLVDSLEYRLAEEFKPFLIFDSDENARLPHEPVTLFQVSPIGCVTKDCTDNIFTIGLMYRFLWQRDGGYGPSSWCGDSHNGDHLEVKLELQSKDGQRWKLTNLLVWKLKSHWPFHSNGNDGRHVDLYLSAGKHHPFFGTSYDHDDSPYSGHGCNDDVNGLGARVWPRVLDTYCFSNSVLCKKGPLNVGERDAHPIRYFINDLSSLGYPDEHAWGTRPFWGGLKWGDEEGTASSDVWFKPEIFSDKGKAFFSLLHKKAVEEGRYLWNADYEGFVEKLTERVEKGFRLVDIETYLDGNSRKYIGVWERGSYNQNVWIGLNCGEFIDKWKELAKRNLRLVDVEVHRVGDLLRYTGVWHSGIHYQKLIVEPDLSRSIDILDTRGFDLVDFEEIGQQSYYEIGLFHKEPKQPKFATESGFRCPSVSGDVTWSSYKIHQERNLVFGVDKDRIARRILANCNWQIFRGHEGGGGDSLQIVSPKGEVVFVHAFDEFSGFRVTRGWKGKTEKGIRIGASVDQFLKAYPEFTKEETSFLTTTYRSSKSGVEAVFFRDKLEELVVGRYFDDNPTAELQCVFLD